jgi:hypothetical protein
VWILFINDVLEDPKEGGLRAEELDPLFVEFALIAELRRECGLGLIAESVDRFSDWIIGEKIGSVTREALLEVARRCPIPVPFNLDFTALDSLKKSGANYPPRESAPCRRQAYLQRAIANSGNALVQTDDS